MRMQLLLAPLLLHGTGAVETREQLFAPPHCSVAPGDTVKLDVGGITLTLWNGTGTVALLNKTVDPSTGFGPTNNFSFVAATRPRSSCHALGDITFRVRPLASKSAPWSYFSSASADESHPAPTVSTSDPRVLQAHDLTAYLDATQDLNHLSHDSNFGNKSPLQVVRSYEKLSGGKKGFVMRFNVTAKQAVELGAVGMAMPAAGQQRGIENSVWNDPALGLDHGYVEWARVVVDEQVLLALPADGEGGPFNSGLEAWRPVMENTCGSDTWEYGVHSLAWAEEWARSVQWPTLYMRDDLNKTGMWPDPATPWPSWSADGKSVPVTASKPWNTPTSRELKAGQTVSFALQFVLAEGGPRTSASSRKAAGKAVVHAVPGYVVSPAMKTARFLVDGAGKVESVSSSNTSILTARTDGSVQGVAPGRATLTISFDDGSRLALQYAVVAAFDEVVALLGRHWANDAWLPRDFPDPFGRSASMMPYDRETKQRVIDDSRAYDVGLSDDAGGGNPLGFAMKVGHGPVVAEEVDKLDQYIKWTLYGVKPDTALPPLKSLQIRPGEPGMETEVDGIRGTMYYYSNAAKPSRNYSGHFNYDYKMQPYCGLDGIEGGPNWCMSEYNANSTGRVFNYPHHTASYYNMYRVSRYHSAVDTERTWQWYLMRAANTTVKFGAPTTGVMDGTLFREVLRSLREEAEVDPKTWKGVADKIEGNMLTRAKLFASEEYPYGSEFAFDTTGQEEVVVWLLHFADVYPTYTAAAKRTVDHILSYMRSSTTWAYHGGTRSWGDLGNNGKWMATKGTTSNFQTRGNMHYRSGLNMIPLIEWYRKNPDDFLLLEISMGAQAGQLTNVEEGSGAPSMMLHMEPHILEFDPHSGDFGLGFFGHTLEAGAYFVRHADLGDLCYQCDASANKSTVLLQPTDSYRQRVFLEPLALYLSLDAGTFSSVAWDADAREVTVSLVSTGTFAEHRLRLEKTSDARPGAGFAVTVAGKAVGKARGAYAFPAAAPQATISYSL